MEKDNGDIILGIETVTVFRSGSRRQDPLKLSAFGSCSFCLEDIGIYLYSEDRAYTTGQLVFLKRKVIIMKKVAILLENLFDERELIYPYIRFLEEGYEVHLVGTERNKEYKSKVGLTETSTHASEDISSNDYDAVVIPGGYSPDHMRRCKSTVDFVRAMNEQNKIIAAICHGPWMLASCCDLSGKKITAFYSIKDDLTNAGAEYVDEEVVVDGNLITSRTPKDLPVFVKTIIVKLG